MSNLPQNLGGQFRLELGGQFAPKLVVNLDWKVVVNLTVFSSKSYIQNQRNTYNKWCIGGYF